MEVTCLYSDQVFLSHKNIFLTYNIFIVFFSPKFYFISYHHHSNPLPLASLGTLSDQLEGGVLALNLALND